MWITQLLPAAIAAPIQVSSLIRKSSAFVPVTVTLLTSSGVSCPEFVISTCSAALSVPAGWLANVKLLVLSAGGAFTRSDRTGEVEFA